MTTADKTQTSFTELSLTAGRVVVGIDGSAGSLRALRYAATVAKWRNWSLHLVYAWHFSPYPVSPYSLDYSEITVAMQEGAEATVRDAEREVLGDEPSIDVTRTIEEGPAARVLIEACKGADLLVVGSRGRGGFSSLLLGSVGQACVHHAHCPVLVVRACDDEVPT